MVDVDADEGPLCVIVEDDARRNFLAFDARSRGEVDVKRVGVWIIIKFYGRNLLSRNALCIVSLSDSVITRKKRPSSSGTAAQKRNRSSSCGSVRSGDSITRMHISRVRYGRSRKMRFSKYGVKL